MVPVVALVRDRDESFGLTLLRHGVQAYLVRSEIDSTPLARALRCAIERSRLLAARETNCLLDDLTGLYNERGLNHIEMRLAELARRLDAQLVKIVVEGSGGSADQDLLVLSLAESIRRTFEPAGVLARIGQTSLAGLTIVRDDGERIAERVRAALPQGATMRTELAGALCENRAV
jgi:GGDEF domain-containing protein